jgi:predicted methyltransferase
MHDAAYASRPLGGLLAALMLCWSSIAAAEPAAVAAALAHPERSDADRTRDASDRPAAVLAFAGLETGDVVLDVLAAAGYYSEIIARSVGDDGRVYLHNNAVYAGFAGDDLEQRLAAGRLPNVVRLDQPLDELDVPAGSVDLAMMVMSWHDMFWTDERWPDEDVGVFVERLGAALAPDGALLIVDHSAPPGTGTSSVDTLHRIDEAAVIDTLTAAGFRLLERSELLRNPADERTLSVFDPQIRRRTDRFILRFAPPGTPD